MNLTERIEEELLATLNDVQKDAVLHDDGPLLILAGAGSGKTRVITHRIAHLCRVRGVAPYNIAAVTFTNKAAEEMRSRLYDLIGPMAESVFVRTFHSLGLYILRRHGEAVGIKSSFTIYDDSAQKTLLKKILKEQGIEPAFLDAGAAGNYINKARDSLIGPDEYKATNDPYREEIREVYISYIRQLRENNAIDFGDLIFESVRLLRDNPDILAHYRNLWRYLMIDEYQDTNHAQYVLGRLIAQEHKNITVVGDDDQSIYSWRGADIENILSFEKDYPKCKILRLEENYRSTTPILKNASRLISNNETRRDKTLFTGKEGGEPVRYTVYDTDSEEVQGIINRLRTMKSMGYKLSDNAIFYRTNAQSRILEQAFRQERIPFILLGGFRFFDRKEIKDFAAYLAVAVNPQDSVSLERIINVPPRGIGDTSLDKLRNLSFEKGISLLEAMEICNEIPKFRAKDKVLSLTEKFRRWIEEAVSQDSVQSLAKRILKESGYEEWLKNDPNPENTSRLENLQEFINTINEYEDQTPAGEASLVDFLQNISLLTSETISDESISPEDTVFLMTLHNAKGLEFPVVHIMGFEEGFMPHGLALEEGGLEEERRLLYVGITRAMEHLFISACKYRRIFGQVQPRMESRFLEELDEEYCELNGSKREGRTQPPRASSHKARVPSARNPNTYKPGEQVFHQKYGEGTVIEVEDTVAGQKIAIRFAPDKSVRNFLTAYTPLSRIQ